MGDFRQAAPWSQKRRNIAGISICAALALGGEAAALVLSSATGHYIRPAFGGLYNPGDGWIWLGMADQQCAIVPHLAQFQGGIVPSATAPPHPIHACIVRPAALRLANVRAIGLAVIGAMPLGYFLMRDKYTGVGKSGRVLPKRKAAPGCPVIEVGTASTGTLSSNALASRNLPRAIRPGQVVSFTRAELSLNIIIFGSTGSGKTASLLYPFLLRFFEQRFGALISNVKTNADLAIVRLAQKTGREDDVFIFGIDAESVNMFDGIARNMVGTHFSALLRLTDKSEKASMWNAQASNYAQDVLGILWYLRKYDGPDEYTICGLNRYLFTPGFGSPERNEKGEAILLGQSVDERMADVVRSIQLKLKGIPKSDESRAALRSELEDDLINISSHYQKIKALTRGEEGKTAKYNVEFTLQQLLNAVCTPQIEKAFFNTNLPKSARPCDMAMTYEGAIFVMNMPASIIGDPASRALTALGKNLFFNAMERRRYYGSEVDQDRLVVCAFDEAQDIITEGDQSVLAKIRDTGAFCLWATQSATALEDRVGPVLAKTVLSNMRQKFYLRGEDDMTNEMAVKLLGDVDVEKTATSSTQQPGKWSPSKGTNTSTHKERAATADLILNLEGDEVYYTGTIDRLAAVGILRTRYEDPMA